MSRQTYEAEVLRIAEAQRQNFEAWKAEYQARNQRETELVNRWKALNSQERAAGGGSYVREPFLANTIPDRIRL